MESVYSHHPSWYRADRSHDILDIEAAGETHYCAMPASGWLFLCRIPGAGPSFSEGVHQHASEILHDFVTPIDGVQRRSSSLGCVFVSEQ